MTVPWAVWYGVSMLIVLVGAAAVMAAYMKGYEDGHEDGERWGRERAEMEREYRDEWELRE